MKMYSDEWGNEYETYKAAQQGVLEMLRDDKEEYWEVISEWLNIPLEIMRWIKEDDLRLANFKGYFAGEIADAEEEWVGDCEIEEIDE